ncbi:Uu.00g124520.m01.CDS01 [Anthostomella pinea]|uniref:Uu.00g124520.m01.CDS01 n=1 Tax=Anthostomella pinea TaxID=933095 RepID=A0AAI8VHM8_9PEZI|nr:Uu.00g124520.m01.CDS01 [Anthostomella pinea]
MWLIDTQTLTLKQEVNPAPGSYAILSHTWEEDEVSFQDFQDLASAGRRKGFGKIQRTCDLARERGLKYAWVDTCCIDKSSSSELSESINSMFRWYRDAAVCFAFLSDLGADVSFEAGFSKEMCRWLRRGWTLQELIAPKEVELYDEAWSLRGTKSQHIPLVSSATGIDSDVLRDSSRLSQILVARRMSWASDRETTRAEDLAYCLLGIFDINMPMLYGEGEKAFMRLQEEIVKQSTDLSLFAWRADALSTQRFRGIFARTPREFIGCTQMRKEIPGARVFGGGFTATNIGLQIETGLWRWGNIHNQQTAVEIMDLHVLEPIPKAPHIRNPLCIYLTKTPQGYVRLKPQELCRLPTHERQLRKNHRKVPRASISILKDVQDWEQDSIDRQSEGSVFIKTPKDSLFIDAEPKELWDNSYRDISFIGPGTGLTGYVELVYLGAKIFILFSTVRPDRPWCKMFSEIEPAYVPESLSWGTILYGKMKEELQKYHTELSDCLRDFRYASDSYFLMPPRDDAITRDASCRVRNTSDGKTVVITAHIAVLLLGEAGDGSAKRYEITFTVDRGEEQTTQ